MTAKPNRRRYRKDPFTPGSGTMPNAMEIWHMLGPLDEVARQMEQKWGIERLPCLVSEATARKFAAARDRLDQLLADNDSGEDVLARIETDAAILRRGWLALDREATEAGAQPFDQSAWSLMVNGMPAVIVRDQAAAATVQALDPHRTVYTLDEVGILIATALKQIAPAVADVKAEFPGATVTAIKPRSQLAKDLDDEIPF